MTSHAVTDERTLAEHRRTFAGALLFFSMWSNLLDIAVAALLVVALLLHIAGPASDPRFRANEELYDGTEAIVLAVRYAAQLVRLATLVRNFRRQRLKDELDMTLGIDFHDVDPATPSDTDADFFDDELGEPHTRTRREPPPGLRTLPELQGHARTSAA